MLSVISTAFLIQQSRASDQGSQLNQHVGSYQSDGINSGSALNQQFFQLSQEVNDIEADSSPRIKLMDRARTTYQQNQGDSSQKKFRNLRSYSSTPPKDVPIQAYTGVFIIVGIAFILMTICVAKLFFKYQYREGQAQLVCKSISENICKEVVPEHKFPNSMLSKAKKRGIVVEPRMEIMHFVIGNAFNGGQYPSAKIKGMPTRFKQHQLERMIDNQPAMGSPVYEKQEYSNLPPIKNKNNQMQNSTALPIPQNLIPQLSMQDNSNSNSHRDGLNNSQMGLLQNQTYHVQDLASNNNYGRYQPSQQHQYNQLV
eukprot:403331428